MDKKIVLWLVSGLMLTIIVGALLFFSANATNNNTTADNNDCSHWRHGKPPLYNKTRSDGKLLLLRSPEMKVSMNRGSPIGNLTRLRCNPELNVSPNTGGSSRMWNQTMARRGDRRGDVNKHPAKMTPGCLMGSRQVNVSNREQTLTANLTGGKNITGDFKTQNDKEVVCAHEMSNRKQMPMRWNSRLINGAVTG